MHVSLCIKKAKSFLSSKDGLCPKHSNQIASVTQYFTAYDIQPVSYKELCSGILIPFSFLSNSRMVPNYCRITDGYCIAFYHFSVKPHTAQRVCFMLQQRIYVVYCSSTTSFFKTFNNSAVTTEPIKIAAINQN